MGKKKNIPQECERVQKEAQPTLVNWAVHWMKVVRAQIHVCQLLENKNDGHGKEPAKEKGEKTIKKRAKHGLSRLKWLTNQGVSAKWEGKD